MIWMRLIENGHERFSTGAYRKAQETVESFEALEKRSNSKGPSSTEKRINPQIEIRWPAGDLRAPSKCSLINFKPCCSPLLVKLLRVS